MSVIEYFYSAHSGYAYIGSKLLSEVAANAGARLDHRPMDLRRVLAVTGPGPTNGRTPERRAYFSGREIERWAEARGLEIITGRMPTYHNNDIALPNGMLIAGLLEGADVDALADRMLEAHWRDDADLADAGTLSRLGGEVGVNAGLLLAAAGSPEVRAIYDANTAEAIERSVFGSPTYFVGGDMFYGQDHLELVERALDKPFSGQWPRPLTS